MFGWRLGIICGVVEKTVAHFHLDPFQSVYSVPIIQSTHAPTPQGDASNRRWLSGAPEGAGSTSNWAEREAMAQKERLSGVEGTIVRCVRCFVGLFLGKG